MVKDIEFTVNGRTRKVQVKPNDLLLNVIRDNLNLKGTKYGCGTGECGTCTVLLDGKPVLSCLTLAVAADGRSITTIEGIGKESQLHPLQQAFVDVGAVQCGYCTPGMILSAKALLDRNADPTEDEIKQAIKGNLCRCTGYVKIIAAIQLASKRMRSGAK